MVSVTAELRIAASLKSKLPQATHFYFNPNEFPHLHQEKEIKWCVPVKIVRTMNKKATVTDGLKEKTYEISQVIPSRLYNLDLKHLLQGLKTYVRELAPRIFLTETINHYNPCFHSHYFLISLQNETNDLHKRSCFEETKKSI